MDIDLTGGAKQREDNLEAAFVAEGRSCFWVVLLRRPEAWADRQVSPTVTVLALFGRFCVKVAFVRGFYTNP